MSGSKRRVPEPPCLDVPNACLWCGARRIPLSEKELAVLYTLTQHAGQMVSKGVLLDAGWPQTFVTEGVLKVCIHRLRRALDDTARQRREPAQLLLLGTFRPEDLLAREHPLQVVLPTLRRQPQVQQLALIPLTAGGVTAYLAARFPVSTLPATLASLLHQRSEGNPLFLVTLVEHLVAQGVLEQAGGTWTLQSNEAALQEDVPDTLQQVIMQRRALCSLDEQRMLAVASVAGISFSAASVAAGLAAEVVETEGRCAEIAQRGLFLRMEGEALWPDGTVATQYSFRHALYQQVLYQQVPAARRLQLHLRIAAREEAGYGAQAPAIAARLALHFERGRDFARAVTYYQHVAATALHRFAYTEAIAHCRQGLVLLATMPETLERHAQERDLLLLLAPALITQHGHTAADVEPVYLRAQCLCVHLSDTSRQFAVLRGLASHYAWRGDLVRYVESSDQLLAIALKHNDPLQLILAYSAVGTGMLMCGALRAGHEYLEHGMRLYTEHRHHAQQLLVGTERDRGVSCFAFAALALWLLGYPDQARTHMQHALTLAEALGHPYTLAHTMNQANTLDRWCGEHGRLAARVKTMHALCPEHGIREYAIEAVRLQGWALVRQGQVTEGLALMQRGVAASRSMRGLLSLPKRLLALADAYGHAGQSEAGLAVLEEALAVVAQSEERWDEAELYCLKGELLLIADCGLRVAALTPAACFQKALEIARQQQAKSWELRAAMSLSRVWQRQGKCQEAQQLLSEVYEWFTEGFDTTDLKDAKALLVALGV